MFTIKPVGKFTAVLIVLFNRAGDSDSRPLSGLAAILRPCNLDGPKNQTNQRPSWPLFRLPDF